jgi:hypothetical protein
MFKTILAKSRLGMAAIAIAVLTLLASCSLNQVSGENFSLYLNGKSHEELIFNLRRYATAHNYHITSQTFPGTSHSNLSHHIMLEGGGASFLIESALAEQCKEGEGRREVVYSRRVFDVTVYSTSYLRPESGLSRQTTQLKNMLESSGFRVMSTSQSCDLL